jgi:hypothetical protein
LGAEFLRFEDADVFAFRVDLLRVLADGWLSSCSSMDAMGTEQDGLFGAEMAKLDRSGWICSQQHFAANDHAGNE